MYKLSKYNFVEEDNDILFLYNAMKDIVITIKSSEKSEILNLMDNLLLFQQKRYVLFKKFCDWGFIIKNSFNEVNYIRFENKKKIFHDRYYRLTINPTLDCNMSCWYCIVDAAGAYRPKIRMNDTVIDNIKKYSSNLIENGHVDGFFLDWFGGEPMLFLDEVIMPISSYVKSLTIKNNIPFTHHITTNGYLINEDAVKKFNRISLNSFQITLDGNKKRHNKIRKHYGEPTFDRIINNINLICNKIENASIVLRINYDRKTLNDIEDIIPLIQKKNRKKIRITLQKVFQLESIKDNIQLKETKEKFELAGFLVNYWAYRPKSFSTCYSDKYAYAAINYDGNVFKCTARDYSDENKMGVLTDKGTIEWEDEKISTMFSHATFENDRCLSCKFLPLCFGPCIQKKYEVDTKKSKFRCLLDDSELSIKTYIIQKAKNRNLL